MKLFGYLFVVMAISCSQKISYYEGYIYNSENKPLSNLFIYAENDSINIKGYTDENGFFKIKKKENSIVNHLKIKKKENSIVNHLKIKKNGKILDSIKIIGIRGGEQIDYAFVNGKNDTIIINEKIVN